jgi:small nuclear ribonucleoprotein B and B'
MFNCTVCSRVIVGTFMAFDKHKNMVLGVAEEFRRIKSKKGSGLTEEKLEKRTLGLIVLRGDSVVSLTIEGPPPPEADDKGNFTMLSLLLGFI